MLENLTSKKQLKTALDEEENMVVVDFFDQCGHCKKMNTILDEYSQTYEDKHIKFFKVDINEDVELATDYSITSIPTTLFFKDGTIVKKVVGAKPDKVRQILESD